MSNPMTPTRPLIPELARMVSERRLKFKNSNAGIDLWDVVCVRGAEVVLTVSEKGAMIHELKYGRTNKYESPPSRTQRQAAAWIASRVGGAGGEEKGLP